MVDLIFYMVSSLAMLLLVFFITKVEQRLIKLEKHVGDLRDTIVPLYILKRSIDIQVALEHEDYLNIEKLQKELDQLKQYAHDKNIPL